MLVSKPCIVSAGVSGVGTEVFQIFGHSFLLEGYPTPPLKCVSESSHFRCL